MKSDSRGITRRSVLAGGGALIVSFSSANLFAQQQQWTANTQPPPAPKPKLPGDLERAPYLDSWIRVDASGAITVFTGKAELGQGLKTAILQVAADELDVPLNRLTLVTADTAKTPNEGYTSGSQSMPEGATAVRNAAAQVRELLIMEAAKRASAEPDKLRAENGSIAAPDGRRFTYGDLVSGIDLHVEAQPKSRLKEPGEFREIGKPVARVDIPAKVTGGIAYVHDLRLEGMVHGRVVRPPSYNATLSKLDQAKIERMAGVLKVVRDGNFLGVIAEKEFQAIKAMRALAEAAEWNETAGLPNENALSEAIMALPGEVNVLLDRNGSAAAPKTTLEATFTKPYTMHGSIGPSCAVALMEQDKITIWSHTQGVFPDRAAISEMLRMPQDQVHIIHAEGAGCYGHNGADDAAADAALLARAFPGRPVRVQWTRDQEHAWEPYGPAMVSKVRGAVDEAGRIVSWDYEFWSNTHSTRPGPAGSLIAATTLAEPFPIPAPKEIPLPAGGGSRNSIPIYTIANAKVTQRFQTAMPVRVSAQRALGAYTNVFSIESFMDELAQAASVDPVEFRLRHLEDPRAKDVVQATAERFRWPAFGKAPAGRGYGFAFARYKNFASYCAVAVEVEVSPETGAVRLVRAVSAIDSGQIVNPNGLANQTEGGILQAASWTLFESVRFDNTHITSIDWSTYPIMRFDAVPDSVEVNLINRPNAPFLGAGEAAQGPTAAAIANAVSRALGRRMRHLPLTRDRIMAA
ncbi:MAG: molybdopterin cofactor-binding domain-containing protein [Rhodomicrobium sp.]